MLNEKQKHICRHFEHHGRAIAHNLALKGNLDVNTREWIYQGAMAMLDWAFEQKKIDIKEVSEWDREEREFREEMAKHGEIK